jgi:hypothetical protein
MLRSKEAWLQLHAGMLSSAFLPVDTVSLIGVPFQTPRVEKSAVPRSYYDRQTIKWRILCRASILGDNIVFYVGSSLVT